jgi:hypothetical protein
MQRYRHHNVATQGFPLSNFHHPLRKIPRQRLDPLKLQQHNRPSHPPAILRITPRRLKRKRPPYALPAHQPVPGRLSHRFRHARRPALPANPRRQRRKRLQTIFADRQPASSRQQPLAQPAPARKKHADDRIANTRNQLAQLSPNRSDPTNRTLRKHTHTQHLSIYSLIPVSNYNLNQAHIECGVSRRRFYDRSPAPTFARHAPTSRQIRFTESLSPKNKKTRSPTSAPRPHPQNLSSFYSSPCSIFS